MRTTHIYHAVDSHTEGMPVRVITGGVPTLPGATMAERRLWFMENLDDLRLLLMREPRGHSAMSGVILQPPTQADADYGVLFIETSGVLPMCGHGTIGTATVLVETGMVEVTEPITTVRLEVPAGLVTAQVNVKGGHAESVTLTNVASFLMRKDATVNVPGLGDITYDLGFGGNFYAFVQLDDLRLPFDRTHKDKLLAAALQIMDAINKADEPVHPLRTDIRGVHHVYMAAPGSTAKHSRHAMAIHPGMFDRSPCGTGTSARMAQFHARGELALNTPFINESIIGSTFTGHLIDTTTVGEYPAVIPTITGRAWVTGTAQYMIDPSDPYPTGFEL